MYFLVPFMLIMTLIWVILLRRQVRKRTLWLQEEVNRHKNTFSELKREKTKLEDSEKKLQRHRETLEEQVAERTRKLNDKVTALNRSQKAMLYMIEDLNSVTAELKSERRKLELSNKELEAFTYSVSHDLRAPLRAINGFSRFLVEDYGPELDDEGRRYIHTIRESALKMDMLITDLLSLSRVSRSQLRFSKVQLDELIMSVYNEVASDQEKEDFNLEIGKMPAIHCDPGLMKQVWQNLIGNALKYSSKSKNKKIVIGIENKKDAHTFSIKDHGAGFDNKYVHKMFGLYWLLLNQQP
jgi:light-regulated signal transduction histidine kinase (bacteriophytochrome)